MAITIKQIAERAGLSVPTVSRILNNDADLFRPETREKVHAAARELGYRPNSYRMALRTKKFNSIGLLYHPDPAISSLSIDLQFTLLNELHRRDQHLVAGHAVHLNGGKGGSPLPKMLREWSVDGLLIDSDAASAEVEELIGRTKIPAIWLNVRRPADCVYADQITGAKEGTEHLLARHHQNVMYLSFADPSHASESREGYTAAMRSAGLAPRLLELPAVEPSARVAVLVEWIRAHLDQNLPTAIFCRGITEAIPLYVAAIQVGLSVPRDLSILSVTRDSTNMLGAPLSSMCLPCTEVATLGLKALDEKIAAMSEAVPPQAVPLRFHEGGTIAAPKPA